MRIMVGPTYLSTEVLPNAADIFYHKLLFYSLPTGFHPTELASVYSFPGYCRKEKVALPGLYWSFCNEYFLNSKLAHDCFQVLEPLRKSGNVKFVHLVYARDIEAISNAAQLIEKDPEVADLVSMCPFPLQLIAREFLSHVLYGVYVEKDFNYGEVVDYLRHYQSKEQIWELICAVLVNRLKVFGDPRSRIGLLVHHPNYRDTISKIHLLMSGKSPERTYEERIEAFSYTLFNRLIHPIYGICNTEKKSILVGEMVKEKTLEIDALIEECRFVASDVVFLQTKDDEVKKKRLAKIVHDRITAPLAQLCEREKAETNQIITDFLTQSGVIAALLSCLGATTPERALLSVALSVAAASASALLRLFITPRVESTIPSRFLVTSLRKMRKKEALYLAEINKLSSSIALANSSF